MNSNYVKMTIDTLVTLPVEKQEEVYYFTKFLKETSKKASDKKKRRKGSVLNIIGLGKSGVGDLTINHDKYIYGHSAIVII